MYNKNGAWITYTYTYTYTFIGLKLKDVKDHFSITLYNPIASAELSKEEKASYKN